MKEIIGNIWNIPCDAICIPTNGNVDGRGRAIMGAGLARQAADRFPDIKESFGLQMFEQPNLKVCIIHRFTHFDRRCVLLSFQTKSSWKDPSNIGLITESAEELVDAMNWEKFRTILLPHVGCGLGKLNWEEEVKPILSKILDNRFIAVSEK